MLRIPRVSGGMLGAEPTPPATINTMLPENAYKLGVEDEKKAHMPTMVASLVGVGIAGILIGSWMKRGRGR